MWLERIVMKVEKHVRNEQISPRWNQNPGKKNFWLVSSYQGFCVWDIFSHSSLRFHRSTDLIEIQLKFMNRATCWRFYVAGQNVDEHLVYWHLLVASFPNQFKSSLLCAEQQTIKEDQNCCERPFKRDTDEKVWKESKKSSCWIWRPNCLISRCLL